MAAAPGQQWTGASVLGAGWWDPEVNQLRERHSSLFIYFFKITLLVEFQLLLGLARCSGFSLDVVCRLLARGPQSLWHLPRSGANSVARISGFFTTEPPGKPERVVIARTTQT
ncbi:unnamed protein product [Rangifer tarandus platyrhynchus]|uniref:Uncharacterized protein n=1 Tax=Rangifer tarandus platyrhynchus TaxID=3082113 RepID=A0ACB1KHI2_RANTA